MKQKIVKNYKGKKAFILDNSSGELYRSNETSTTEIFLTFSDYLKLKELNILIVQKCALHREQIRQTIDTMRYAIQKIEK